MASKKKPTEKQKPHALNHTQGDGPSPLPEPEPTPSTGPVEEAAPDLHQGFPIVGIGASAGGLAAFEAFFSGMPTASDMGMAFVLVQHLAPPTSPYLGTTTATFIDLETSTATLPQRWPLHVYVTLCPHHMPLALEEQPKPAFP